MTDPSSTGDDPAACALRRLTCALGILHRENGTLLANEIAEVTEMTVQTVADLLSGAGLAPWDCYRRFVEFHRGDSQYFHPLWNCAHRLRPRLPATRPARSAAAGDSLYIVDIDENFDRLDGRSHRRHVTLTAVNPGRPIGEIVAEVLRHLPEPPRLPEAHDD